MNRSDPCWSADGLSVRQLSPYERRLGLTVQAGSSATCIHPVLAGSLRDWLTWYMADDGETPPPPPPDAIRLAVSEQRAELERLSSSAGTTEEFRSGLAWADNALRKIAEACQVEAVSR